MYVCMYVCMYACMYNYQISLHFISIGPQCKFTSRHYSWSGAHVFLCTEGALHGLPGGGGGGRGVRGGRGGGGDFQPPRRALISLPVHLFLSR